MQYVFLKTMEYLPDSVITHIAQYMYDCNIKCLRCTCHRFANLYYDKLDKYQTDIIKFLLDRESVGLSSIATLDVSINKIAIMIYAYKRNPIPTLIITKQRFHTMWSDEMIKHNIMLPICMRTRVHELPNLHTYRRVIYDDVNETVSSNRDRLINGIKDKVVWGLSSSAVSLCSGRFRSYHLSHIFGPPDCIIHIKRSHMQDNTHRFSLPQIERIDMYNGIEEYTYNTNPWMIKCKAIANFVKSIMILSHSVIYDNVSYMLYKDEVEPCEYINSDGSFTIERKYFGPSLFTSIDINKLTLEVESPCGPYIEIYKNEFLITRINELTNQGTKRSIVYIRIAPTSDIKGSIEGKSFDELCYLFSNNEINTLVIPQSYNIKYNVGTVDLVIITTEVNYIQFQQIMNTVTRLDVNNSNCIVYIPLDTPNCTYSRYISKYREEFV